MAATLTRCSLFYFSCGERLSGVNGRSDSSKALYYTLASSTVLEKNNFSGNTRELDNVFLAAAKYGDMDILLRTLERHSININVRDEANGDTALLLAAKSNNNRVVEALVERGADVTLLNEEGKGALDLGSNYLKLSVLSKYPKNPAHSGVAVVKAAWQGDIGNLRNLLASSKGGSANIVNIRTEEGLTPLLVVTRDISNFLRLQRSVKLSYDPTKVIQELLKHKANVNATDLEGHTALHFATRISPQKLCRDIVEILLFYRPTINNLDRTNLAPLHTATNNDNAAVVGALVAAGADPNLHGIGGATPLHIGAQQENEDIIRKLVLAGGDVNALDNAGMTPLCVARSTKIRDLMRSLFADLSADKGVMIKLKYDELISKRKIQKMLEHQQQSAASVPPQDLSTQEETTSPDYRPLQRALINEAYRNKYDYDTSKRKPRLEARRVTLDYTARRRSGDKAPVNLFPRIEPENPVLLLKRNSPIEVPVLQRHQSRLKNGPSPGVFITQRQNSYQKKQQNPRTRPPIPRHSCGFIKPDRTGSGKTRKSEKGSSGSAHEIAETEQWLPGAPKILGGSEGSRSRPTSAVTGSSSGQSRGPKIHLKHVLKNILNNMDPTCHVDLLDRYVKQQRPVRVKEMGFVDFLLQDNDPEKMSEASSTIRSQKFSDSSSLSGQSIASAAVSDVITPPLLETLAAARVSIGEITPQMQPLNLPQLRQHPAPGPDKVPLKASSKPINDRRGPQNLPLRRNSEDNKKMSIVTISSPYSSAGEPRISSRSSKDSGYGSLATLLYRPPEHQASPTKSSEEEMSRTKLPADSDLEEEADHHPKHITAVVVNQDLAKGDEVPSDEDDHDVTPRPDVAEDVPTKKVKEEPDSAEVKAPPTNEKVQVPDHRRQPDQHQGPVVGVNRLGVLQGNRMKTVPKLLGSGNIGKSKEHGFKKKVYSRKLPQIKEESRGSRRGDSAVSRFRRREKRAAKSAKSGTSSSSTEKESQPDSASERPGTVPSKPVLGLNIPSKSKRRPKTSESHTTITSTISSSTTRAEKGSETTDITEELHSITDKHDQDLLRRLTTLRDLDALVSTSPLKLDRSPLQVQPPTQVEGATPSGEEHPETGVKFNDTRSLWSERRSAITSFTGTTRIESIMGDTTQWKKGKLLGSGGGGKVWYGMTQERIEVAVKQIELCGEEDETRDEYSELQEEVKLLKCLKHDNIIRYYGTCLQDNRVNIFMEFIEGGSLASRIKKQGGSLPERQIQNYTYQLLGALKYIHAKNIVHRDIKGQNIMITCDDKVKLIDFGCGKRLRRSIQNPDVLKTMRGTPYWMSPEVIRGEGHGIKSDIWSLSCTIFEMLDGNPPWHTLPTVAAIYKIGTGKLPDYPGNASDYCIEFMKTCFITEPKQRPTTEDLLKHEFIELFSNRIKHEE